MRNFGKLIDWCLSYGVVIATAAAFVAMGATLAGG